MGRLSLSDVNRDRYTPGRSLLLFLTDRCPVGCGHCSVDSRRDSPTITDYDLFARLLDGICDDPALRLVGISGGEPFVERRGLTIAMRRLSEAGKDICLYTSGVWARSGAQPAWIREILPLASCLFLSTDAFHAAAIDDTRWVAAARAVGEAGVPIFVQVINRTEQVAEAKRMLTAAFGGGWAEYAELSYIEPLAYGRGADLFAPPPTQEATSVGPCALLAAPVVRYDGSIAVCCNEAVIMGRGPDRLRSKAGTAEEVTESLTTMREDALLTAIATVGAGAVTAHPAYASLAGTRVRGICDLCWRLQEATSEPLGDRSDRILTVLPLLVAGPARAMDPTPQGAQ